MARIMYTRKGRLSPRRHNRLLEYFVAGTTARAAVEIIGVQPNTAIRFYMRLRFLIASYRASQVVLNLKSKSIG